jgi:hypothetical protein
VVTYNDPRYTYEGLALTYGGTITQTVMGSQSSGASGSLAGSGDYHRTVTGLQPAERLILYEHPNTTYEEIGVYYQSTDPGRLIRRGVFHRLLEGTQPPPSGVLQWRWVNYVQAQYLSAIEGYPEEIAYLASVAVGDPEVRYSVGIDGERQGTPGEAVYVHPSVKQHIRGT